MSVEKKNMLSPEKGIQNFVQRAILTTNTEKGVTELFLSKQEERNIKKYPEWDKPKVYPASEVIRARRDLTHVEQVLRTAWANREKKRKVMDEQWNEMRRQELLFRQSFVKFNKFVKENQDKRERAEAKIKEEEDRQTKQQEEVDNLTQRLNFMKNVRDDMKKYVAEYKKYQTYLERVVSDTGEFESINEIFNRYETLIEARTVLSEHQDKNLQKLEETGTEIHHMSEAKSQMLMGLNNRLALLQARYDKAKALALKWETIVTRIKATAAEKNLELTQVKICCWNIYQQICKRKDLPTEVSRDDIEQQLLHIKRTIYELRRIIRVAKKKATKEELLNG